MSFVSLCDHRGIVYRATETKDALQGVVQTWAALPAPTGRNCRPHQAWSGSLVDRGPGEQQATTRQWFLLAGLDVAQRDVLSIVEGPEAGKLFRVLSVTQPTGGTGAVHHIEVNTEYWAGSLT